MTVKTPRDDQIPTRQGLMRIETLAVDEAGAVRFQALHEVDAVGLMVMAESREELARSKGRAFTEGAIPFFGAELIAAARSGKRKDELHKAAIDVALAAWLVDSIYGGVSAQAFMNSNLRFTMLPGGAVKYDRLPIADSV